MTLTYLKKLKEPESLALELEEVKKYLKIDSSEEDNLLETLIDAATQKCERYTNLAIIKQKFRYSIFQPKNTNITLPVTPLVVVESVSCNTLFSNFTCHKHQYDTFADKVYLRTNIHLERVHIDYTAGISDNPAQVPADIKSLLLEHVAFLFENRESDKEFPMQKYNIFKNYSLI